MAGFLFRLETVDGAAADPPTLASGVPNWAPGDTIPLGQRTLRVIGEARRRRGPTARAGGGRRLRERWAAPPLSTEGGGVHPSPRRAALA
jgi:hypothetical protein